jgi:hypothetical protein
VAVTVAPGSGGQELLTSEREVVDAGADSVTLSFQLCSSSFPHLNVTIPVGSGWLSGAAHLPEIQVTSVEQLSWVEIPYG